VAVATGADFRVSVTMSCASAALEDLAVQSQELINLLDGAAQLVADAGRERPLFPLLLPHAAQCGEHLLDHGPCHRSLGGWAELTASRGLVKRQDDLSGPGGLAMVAMGGADRSARR